MTIIKSFSVGEGDMFYIKHETDNFSIIDCHLLEENRDKIVEEILEESKYKNITRFISTHPDEDHIHGLEYLDYMINIRNFYCVKNQATKAEETDDFKKYCELRDSSKIAFYIKKGCTRKWMNESGNGRNHSGIHILWPDLENTDFKEELEKVKKGSSPNNISPIIKYIRKNGATVMWMGDIKYDFLEKIKDKLKLTKIDILFAPHHGRNTGKIPKEILDILNPKIVIIGEAPSEDLNYYKDFKAITQNSAGDITFECVDNKVHIYVSKEGYKVDFLDKENVSGSDYYIGTLNL